MTSYSEVIRDALRRFHSACTSQSHGSQSALGTLQAVVQLLRHVEKCVLALHHQPRGIHAKPLIQRQDGVQYLRDPTAGGRCIDVGDARTLQRAPQRLQLAKQTVIKQPNVRFKGLSARTGHF